MKVKKLLKGLLAAALAVTMAVTPAASVKAAETTVTSGASVYVFSETPIAAFEVTGFYTNYTAILYCLPRYTDIYSQSGNTLCVWNWWKESSEDGTQWFFASADGEDGYEMDKAMAYSGLLSGSEYSEYFEFIGIAQKDVQGFNSILAIGVESDQVALIPAAFANTKVTAVQISVEDALARDNANVQSNAPQADAQAAAQAQAAADAQAAAQTQITAQQQSVSQGTYTVEAGDNLCKIAQKVYGDAKAWREIYKANSSVVKSNYIIYKGQVLTIPAR